MIRAKTVSSLVRPTSSQSRRKQTLPLQLAYMAGSKNPSSTLFQALQLAYMAGSKKPSLTLFQALQHTTPSFHRGLVKRAMTTPSTTSPLLTPLVRTRTAYSTATAEASRGSILFAAQPTAVSLIHHLLRGSIHSAAPPITEVGLRLLRDSIRFAVQAGTVVVSRHSTMPTPLERGRSRSRIPIARDRELITGAHFDRCYHFCWRLLLCGILVRDINIWGARCLVFFCADAFRRMLGSSFLFLCMRASRPLHLSCQVMSV